MSLKARLARLEERAEDAGRVPFIITQDGRSWTAEDGEITPDEWRRRYGAQIERERAAGREVFGINFDPHPCD